MDTLFWLTAQDPAKLVTVKLINTAMLIHKGRKIGIHAQIRTWVDEQGPLERIKTEGAIQEIEKLIQRYRFKPESVETADDEWLSASELATKAEV